MLLQISMKNHVQNYIVCCLANGARTTFYECRQSFAISLSCSSSRWFPVCNICISYKREFTTNVNSARALDLSQTSSWKQLQRLAFILRFSFVFLFRKTFSYALPNSVGVKREVRAEWEIWTSREKRNIVVIFLEHFQSILTWRKHLFMLYQAARLLTFFTFYGPIRCFSSSCVLYSTGRFCEWKSAWRILKTVEKKATLRTFLRNALAA